MPLEMPEKDNTFVLKVSLTLSPMGPLAAPDYLPRGGSACGRCRGRGPRTLHRCQAPRSDLNLGPGFRTKRLGCHPPSGAPGSSSEFHFLPPAPAPPPHTLEPAHTHPVGRQTGSQTAAVSQMPLSQSTWSPRGTNGGQGGAPVGWLQCVPSPGPMSLG